MRLPTQDEKGKIELGLIAGLTILDIVMYSLLLAAAIYIYCHHIAGHARSKNIYIRSFYVFTITIACAKVVNLVTLYIGPDGSYKKILWQVTDDIAFTFKLFLGLLLTAHMMEMQTLVQLSA